MKETIEFGKSYDRRLGLNNRNLTINIGTILENGYNIGSEVGERYELFI